MAITNAQQYQQLVNKRADGKRPGYRGEAAAASDAAAGRDAGRSSPGAADDRGSAEQNANQRAQVRAAQVRAVENLIDRPAVGFSDAARINLFNYSPTSLAVKGIKNLGTAIANSKIAQFMNAKQREAYLDSLDTDEQVAALEALGKIGIGTTNPMGIDRNITRGTEKGIFGTNIGGGQFITDPNLGSVEAKTALGTGYQDYLDDITSRFDNTDGGDGGQTYIPPVLTPYQEDVVEEVDPNSLQGLLANRIAYRFMADGGRAAYQDGSPAVDPRMARSLQENVAANEAQRASNQSFKDMIVQRIQKANPAGTGNFLQGIKDFGQHAMVSEAMAGKTGMPVIPEYGMQSGYDFQKKFTGLDPKISSGLAAAYQTLQEGSRALNPFGDTFLRFPTAMKTAQQQATQNIEGILAAESNNLTPQQQADRNKYLAALGQPIEQSNSDVSSTSDVIPNFEKLSDGSYRDTRSGDIYGSETYGSIAAGMYPDIYNPNQQTTTPMEGYGTTYKWDSNTGKYNLIDSQARKGQGLGFMTAGEYGDPMYGKILGINPDNTLSIIGDLGKADTLSKEDYEYYNPNNIYGDLFNFYNTGPGYASGGRVGLMGGGMPDDFIGGLADGNLDEMGRQMYGLGKLVKKATRAVKKIVKSPVGKAALAFGAYKLGGGLLKNDAIKKFLFAGKDPAFANLTGKGILAGIGGISALSGLMSQPEEDEEETYYRGPGLDIAAIRRDPYAARGPAYGFYAEGGDVKEPVAKDTMPLLDMNGMEKDYRADGGFVPIGRMERADDVPARLSKNEFVFTADAVRNAGDGDVDKGAEVMYNMMKNLESGGKVSEESQGLDGARDMFQTSKRLEEVL